MIRHLLPLFLVDGSQAVRWASFGSGERYDVFSNVNRHDACIARVSRLLNGGQAVYGVLLVEETVNVGYGEGARLSSYGVGIFRQRGANVNIWRTSDTLV